MRIAITLCAVLLTGCAGSGQLLRNGQSFPLQYNSVLQTITTKVDGEEYAGNYVMNSSSGFASGFAGTRFVTTNVLSAGNQGRALLTSPSGKTLRCEFMVDGFTTLGQCQDQAGAIYDLKAIGG